jgi:glycosidase
MRLSCRLYYLYSVFIENHDQSRAVSRFGSDSPQWRALSAKMLSILQITQGGTLYVYQGQEIAMSNFPETWSIDEYKDVATINYWNRCVVTSLRLPASFADLFGGSQEF